MNPVAVMPDSPAAMIAEGARGTKSSNSIAVSRMSKTEVRRLASKDPAPSSTPAVMASPPEDGSIRAYPSNSHRPRIVTAASSTAVSHETTRRTENAACWAPKFSPRSKYGSTRSSSARSCTGGD